MKINEAIKPSRKTLVESFKADEHDSQFLAEDLADMVKEDESGQWVATPADDYLARLKAGKPSWA
jgi:hypothetical protein